MSELFDATRRAELAQLIDGAVRAVLADYERFLNGPGETDKPAEFGRRHNAAKAALGHLEALQRLYGQLAAPPQAGTARSEAELLAEARAHLAALEGGDHPAPAMAEATPEAP